MSAEDQNQAMDTTDAAAAAAAAAAEDDRKLFVGGLPQDAKEADIKEHFGQFGAIGPQGVNLKTDASTGRSRGFAFVVFEETEGVEKAVAAATHNIKGKDVAVKKAQAKTGKVYVGKLKPELTDEQIKEFFSQYGTINQVEQPFDKVKNERKNFCFITFDKEETAKKLLKEGSVSINGNELEIKKVTPKPAGGGMGMGGFGGGRGGGRGGQQGGYGGYGGQQWGGNYAGYGDAYGWGGYGGPDAYGAYGGWGGYGGGNQWGYGGPGQVAGGKARGGPRGGGAGRGRGVGAGRGQRQKPY